LKEAEGNGFCFGIPFALERAEGATHWLLARHAEGSLGSIETTVLHPELSRIAFQHPVPPSAGPAMN
jgi:hypothetical protein